MQASNIASLVVGGLSLAASGASARQFNSELNHIKTSNPSQPSRVPCSTTPGFYSLPYVMCMRSCETEKAFAINMSGAVPEGAFKQSAPVPIPAGAVDAAPSCDSRCGPCTVKPKVFGPSKNDQNLPIAVVASLTALAIAPVLLFVGACLSSFLGQTNPDTQEIEMAASHGTKVPELQQTPESSQEIVLDIKKV